MSFSAFFEHLQQSDQQSSPSSAGHWSTIFGSSWPSGDGLQERASMRTAAEGYQEVCEPSDPRSQGRTETAEEIARELGLRSDATVEELKRIRRLYALSNHPDVSAEGGREAATRRMQIANLLIDEALRRAGETNHN